ARVRVLRDDLRALHRRERDAGTHVDAGTDGTLVQVRLAVRLARGEAHHGHHGHAPVDDDANVRYALEGDVLERRVEVDARLDERLVGLAAQAEEPGQDVRHV